MSNVNNLPSTATRNDNPGGERSSVTKTKDTALFAAAVDGMMDLTRIENGELNKLDLESMIEKTEKMVLERKKEVRVKQMYMRYQIIYISCIRASYQLPFSCHSHIEKIKC